MFIKRKHMIFFGKISTICLLFLFHPVFAQMKSIAKFKGVNIPFNLKHEDSLIAKGKYDFEIFVSAESTGSQSFYLTINKGKKSLCLLLGQKLEYATSIIMKLQDDPNIPDKPRLKMKKNTSEKMLYIIFESGKRTAFYPLERYRFRIEYE